MRLGGLVRFRCKEVSSGRGGRLKERIPQGLKPVWFGAEDAVANASAYLEATATATAKERARKGQERRWRMRPWEGGKPQGLSPFLWRRGCLGRRGERSVEKQISTGATAKLATVEAKWGSLRCDFVFCRDDGFLGCGRRGFSDSPSGTPSEWALPLEGGVEAGFEVGSGGETVCGSAQAELQEGALDREVEQGRGGEAGDEVDGGGAPVGFGGERWQQKVRGVGDGLVGEIEAEGEGREGSGAGDLSA